MPTVGKIFTIFRRTRRLLRGISKISIYAVQNFCVRAQPGHSNRPFLPRVRADTTVRRALNITV